MLYQRSSVRVKHDRSQKIINEIVEGIIDKKFAELNWNDVDDNNNSEDASRTPKSVIESLLGHYPVMSREQIRNELVTILIGGCFASRSFFFFYFRVNPTTARFKRTPFFFSGTRYDYVHERVRNFHVGSSSRNSKQSEFAV